MHFDPYMPLDEAKKGIAAGLLYQGRLNLIPTGEELQGEVEVNTAVSPSLFPLLHPSPSIHPLSFGRVR